MPTTPDAASPANPASPDTGNPNLSTEHQREGDAKRPSDTLDKGQPNRETIPRKSSLTGD